MSNPFLPALAALVLAALANLGCDLSRSCGQAGCFDQASIRVSRADGATPALAVELEVDGRRVICPAPPLRTARGAACDDALVRVEHRELADCTETRTAEARSLSCVPNGRFEQVIGFAGTPGRIVATLKSDSGVVAQRTFDLTYMNVHPNGEGCEPVCRQGARSWPLP